MKYKELRIEFDRLKKIHEATNGAVIALETENKQLFQANGILEARNKQLLQQLEVRGRISNRALEKANTQNNDYLIEINRLRAERDGNIS